MTYPETLEELVHARIERLDGDARATARVPAPPPPSQLGARRMARSSPRKACKARSPMDTLDPLFGKKP